MPATAPAALSPLRSLLELAAIAATFLIVRYLMQLFDLAFAGQVAVALAFLVATMLLYRDGEGWRALGFRLPQNGRQWLALPLLTLLAMATAVLLVLVVVPALTGVGPDDGVQGAEAFAFLKGNTVAFLLFLLLVVWGTAAFGEEMLFRGFLFGRLETLFGGGAAAAGAAVLVQAVLFGLGHAYQGWSGILLTGGIGLAMGIIYLLGGRWLLPVILAHGLIDTISIGQIYASG